MALQVVAPSQCPPTLYKGLGRWAQSVFGGTAFWNLPAGDSPGAWMSPVARISPGSASYHLTGASDLLRCWLAPRIFIAEGRGVSSSAPAGTAIAFQEARLVRELPWDLGVARRLYRDCLEFAVAEARPHGDFLDEARHRRNLAEASFWTPDSRWYEAVRVGLAELAVAVGDIWYRDQYRRRDAVLLPRRAHIEQAHDWQLRRFLERLDDAAPCAKGYMLA